MDFSGGIHIPLSIDTIPWRIMKTLLVLTTSVAILLTVIIFILLLKNRTLAKKIKYVDDANMWHKLAVTDDLTGVSNRNAYNLYISKNRKKLKDKFRAIILFDVDDFKLVNDTQGHLAGDKILKDVAKILLEIFSYSEFTVFRIGGDEFAVLAEGVLETEIIEHLIVLNKRLSMEGKISLSKGYSLVKDNRYEEAFKFADDMLYADKLSKKLRMSVPQN